MRMMNAILSHGSIQTRISTDAGSRVRQEICQMLRMTYTVLSRLRAIVLAKSPIATTNKRRKKTKKSTAHHMKDTNVRPASAVQRVNSHITLLVDPTIQFTKVRTTFSQKISVDKDVRKTPRAPRGHGTMMSNTLVTQIIAIL